MPQRDGYENATSYVVSLALIWLICMGLLRLWIRKSAYGRDDVVIGAATLVALGHTGSSYAALSSGLGKPWSGILAKDDLASLNEASIAGIVLFFAALYLSKCAMLAFLSRITKTPSQILLYHTCNGIVGLLGVVSIVTALAACPSASGYYWAFRQNASTCPSQDVRWQVITALDIITEVLLLVLPVHLVWNLHMPLAKKAMIIVAFWIRLPSLGFSIARNYYTLQLQRPKPDAGLDSALVAIWLEAELAYAIGASTLSALKSFTESVNTGFGLGFTRGKGEDSYGMSGLSGSSSRTEKAKSATQSQSRGARSAGSPPSDKKPPESRVSPAHHTSEEPSLKLRPETGIATFTSVSAGDGSTWRGGSSASDSSGDDMVIVRQTVCEIYADEAPILRPVVDSRA